MRNPSYHGGISDQAGGRSAQVSSADPAPTRVIERGDGYTIRRTALKFRIPYTTTAAGALALCKGVRALKERLLSVKPIQDYHC